MNAEEFAFAAIKLFDKYRENFGCTNEDFPDDLPQDRQCEFEDKMNELICAYKRSELDKCLRGG